MQFYWEVFVFYYQSDIAIDDIDIKRGLCKVPADNNVQTSIPDPPTAPPSLSTTITPAPVVTNPAVTALVVKATTTPQSFKSM